MYSYRAKTGTSELRKEREKTAQGLELLGQQLSCVVSRMRTLTSGRNQHIAQALKDGLKVAALAEAAGVTHRTIRTIAQSYEDIYPTHTPREIHLNAIRAKTAELLAAKEKRAKLERQRDRLIVRAYQVTGYDPLDLAIASGLTVEQVRKTTRGLRRGNAMDDHGFRPASAAVDRALSDVRRRTATV
ncbi:hypothetical protein ACFQ36_18800 [Arthrobacter sp. GCM10027362]|uniref:hypothetical protein n=1 Tax=Arthrobacter sp. GCM10027362 TaxID=3273379 RepID=UPI003632A0D2